MPILREKFLSYRFNDVHDVRHMVRLCTSVLWYRKQRRAENYLDVGQYQPFRVRDGDLPVQSEGKA